MIILPVCVAAIYLSIYVVGQFCSVEGLSPNLSLI